MKPLPILLLFFLLLPLGADAQKKDNFWTDLNDFLNLREDKSYAKLDTNYVGRYPYHWDARIFYKSISMHVNASEKNGFLLTTGMRQRIGVALSYRGLGLSYSHALGKKFNVDLGLDSYGKHFCFEYSFRATTDLTGNIIPMSQSPGSTEEPKLLLVTNKLNLFYSFNKRFSYGAAMKQTKIQRKSAGSFIAAFNWSVWDLMTMEDEIVNLKDFYKANFFYQRFSIGAGYGYNVVLGHQHWLLHASIIPMWTVYDMQGLRHEEDKTRTSYPYGKVSFTGTARSGVYYRWGTRWSVGCSGIVNQLASSNHFSKKASDFSRFSAQEWQIYFSVCFRF